MTGTKEDYLVEIARLERATTLVSNKQLSAVLGVSAPSVSEMLVTLKQDGFIDYLPYKGSRLTPLGKEKADLVLRRHRVWESFLEGRLGYSGAESHQLAHQLEHVTGSDLIDRLERYLEESTFPRKEG